MLDAYLLDTNVVSALWDQLHEQHKLFRGKLRELADALIYISVVSRAEIEYGLRTAPNVDAERQRVVKECMEQADFVVLDIGRHVAKSYAQIRSRLFKLYSPRDKRGRLKAKRVSDLVERTSDKQLGMDENDLWLASSAMSRNLVFVTNEQMDRIFKAAGEDLRFEIWG